MIGLILLDNINKQFSKWAKLTFACSTPFFCSLSIDFLSFKRFAHWAKLCLRNFFCVHRNSNKEQLYLEKNNDNRVKLFNQVMFIILILCSFEDLEKFLNFFLKLMVHLFEIEAYLVQIEKYPLSTYLL